MIRWLKSRRARFKRLTSGLLPLYEYRRGERAFIIYRGNSEGLAVYLNDWWIATAAKTGEPRISEGPYPSLETAKAAAKAALSRRESVASSW